MVVAKLKEDEFVIVCPHCNHQKKIARKKLAGSRSAKMRCGGCNYYFDLEIEHRNQYRKECRLDGFFQEAPTDRDYGKSRWCSTGQAVRSRNCHVTNLSMNGLAFVALYRHSITVGQVLGITFTLDDVGQTTLCMRVTVRGVTGNHISCEFIDEDKKNVKIGFYLL